MFCASDPRAHPQHEDQGSLYHALNHVLEHRVAVGPLHGPFPCQLLPEQGVGREPGGTIKRSRGKGQVVKVSVVMVRKCKKGL